MLLKSVVRLNLCLIMVAVMAACSDNPDTATTTFPLASPARLAAVDSETLLVSDYTENRFCTVDKISMDIVHCFPAKGQPTGVAYVDYRGGRYFVGNRSVRSVDIFDIQGNFLGHLGGKTGLFEQVNDFAVNEDDGFIYVLDSKAAVVKVYDLDGNLFLSDLTSGGLIRPTAIDFSPDRTIYISDVGGFGDINDPADDVMPQVRMFDLDGVQTGAIVAFVSGGFFDKSQSFSTPQGLAVYNGHLFVVDSTSSQVQVYDLTTKLQVKTIGVRGIEEGQLFYPLDVHVDAANGDVFVADNRNGRVSVYRGEGMVP